MRSGQANFNTMGTAGKATSELYSMRKADTVQSRSKVPKRPDCSWRCSKSGSEGLKKGRLQVQCPNRSRALPICCQMSSTAKPECFQIVSNRKDFFFQQQENKNKRNLCICSLFGFETLNTVIQESFEICDQPCNCSSVPLNSGASFSSHLSYLFLEQNNVESRSLLILLVF